jgi:hypothetical protein
MFEHIMMDYCKYNDCIILIDIIEYLNTGTPFSIYRVYTNG